MPKNSELMSHGLVITVSRRDALLDLGGETVVNLHHFRAFGADQMMMMSVISFAHQFKPRQNRQPKSNRFHHLLIFSSKCMDR